MPVKFSIPIVFLFLVSCHSESKSPVVNVLGTKGNFLADSSKQRMLKIIEGGWVNEEYISAFRETFSPMAAATHGLPRQQMAFDISNINGDTVINAMGRLNYHEGERFDVVFYLRTDGKTGMKIKEDRNQLDESLLLNYSIEGKDTILLLTINDGEKTVTNRFRNQFREFPETDDVHLTAMEYFVNKNLFEGNWKMSGQTISFSGDGRVKNFHAYKRYSVSTVEENPTSRPDEISFYNDSTEVTYAFTFNHQRIQLYEIKESTDALKFSRGKMIGELERE